VLRSFATTVVTPRKYPGREALRIYLVDGGGVDQVDAGRGGGALVVLAVARVTVEILAGSELGRVDEQAHDDDVALVPGGLEQRDVSGVEEAHRRDEPDRPALAARLAERVPELPPGFDDPHAPAPSRRAATSRVRLASSS
jgi:hypothetical protein